MVPSLNAVSIIHAAGQAFNSPPMNLVWSRGQSVNCYYTSVIWKIACQRILDSFALGIEYLGKLCGITNTLQKRRFTCVRSADNENPEPTNTVEVLLDLRRVQAKILFNTWRSDCDLCGMVLISPIYKKLRLHYAIDKLSYYLPFLVHGRADTNMPKHLGAILELLWICTTEDGLKGRWWSVQREGRSQGRHEAVPCIGASIT